MATIVVYSILLIVLTPPLGAYMYRVYTRSERGRVENVIYRLIRVNPDTEQSWRRYASCVLWFSAVSMLFIYLLFRFQEHLPLNPQGLPGVNPYVAFNTAASFVTNTNWQTYGSR
jgi:K+-transporting ATPase ATPase A chain